MKFVYGGMDCQGWGQGDSYKIPSVGFLKMKQNGYILGPNILKKILFMMEFYY